MNSVKTNFELPADVGFIREKASSTAAALISGVHCICHILPSVHHEENAASGFDILGCDSPEGSAAFIPALK